MQLISFLSLLTWLLYQIIWESMHILCYFVYIIFSETRHITGTFSTLNNCFRFDFDIVYVSICFSEFNHCSQPDKVIIEMWKY